MPAAPTKPGRGRPKPAQLPPWEGGHYLGIDENGVGPRLGPMIVTAVHTEVDERGRKLVTSRPRGAVAARIGDSKKLVAFDDNALGEAWARAIVTRAMAVSPRSPSELLAKVSLDASEVLREPCPSHHAEMCWSDDGETFSADDATLAACARDLERLEARGIRVAGVRVAMICTRRLNDAAAKGLSRFDVDLHAMERLTLAARADAGADVYALCGKVGGFDFYADRFGPLAGWLHTPLVEGRARSEYLVPGVGRLAFVRDADDTHLIVGLASLVGKWVRDHLMRRVVRWHRSGIPDLPDASGYHDPVTTQFIHASKLLRRERRVEAACFERVSIGTSAKTLENAKKRAAAAAAAPTSSARTKT